MEPYSSIGDKVVIPRSRKIYVKLNRNSRDGTSILGYMPSFVKLLGPTASPSFQAPIHDPPPPVFKQD